MPKPCSPTLAQRRSRRRGVQPSPVHRCRAGVAVVVRGRHRGAGDARRGGTRGCRAVAAAHRPPPERRRSTCAMRPSNSAASDICVSTANGLTNITTTSPGFIAAATAAGAAAHQSAASSQRAAEASWRAARQGGGAARARRHDAEALETAAAEAGLVVTACRSFAEWDAIRKAARWRSCRCSASSGSATRRRNALRAAERPLCGVKVLDLTRIIAGPVCGRTLAAHGADVLLVTAKHLASMLPLVIDTGRGKLSTSIDLRDQAAARCWRRSFPTPTFSCRATGPARLPRMVFHRKRRAAPPWDHLRLAVRLRPRRPVGWAARF